VKLYLGDCLEVMRKIPDKSIDMVLADPPYGTTACKWDSVIPLDKMWYELKKLIKTNGAVVLTATNPFASTLIVSNISLFRYEWVWDKTRGYNFQQANFCPMKSHELALVFSKSNCVYSGGKETMRYFPRKTEGKEYIGNIGTTKLLHNNTMKKLNKKMSGRFPLTIQTFKKEIPPSVLLLRYCATGARLNSFLTSPFGRPKCDIRISLSGFCSRR